MRGTIGIMRTAILAATLLVAAPAARADPHEPLATFFENLLQPQTAPRERRPRRHVPRPGSAGPQAFAARRTPSAPSPRPDFVVGVFGDAFAASIAHGLSDTGSSDAGRKVFDASADDAGIATVDAAAWERTIDAVRKEGGRLDAAVVMVGREDGVALADGRGQRQDPGSAGWRALYGDRVAAVANRFRDQHVPLIWVGLPIVRDAAAAQLYATMNEIVHDRATREGAAFVDSWQAFADENGDFSTAGPDVDGRPATLRWSNGWNFTHAGARKLASFVLPDLKRVRDRATSSRELAAVPNANPDSFDQALDIDVNAQILREAGLPAPSTAKPADVAAQPKVGPVLMLTAAPLASEGRLASIESALHAAAGGDAPQTPHAGRADDFAWPGP